MLGWGMGWVRPSSATSAHRPAWPWIRCAAVPSHPSRGRWRARPALAVWSVALECLLRAARGCVDAAPGAERLEGLPGSAAAVWEAWVDGVVEREWWQGNIACPAWVQACPAARACPEWIATAAAAWRVWLGCDAGAGGGQALHALIQLHRSATGDGAAAAARLQSDLQLVSAAVGCASRGEGSPEGALAIAGRAAPGPPERSFRPDAPLPGARLPQRFPCLPTRDSRVLARREQQARDWAAIVAAGVAGEPADPNQGVAMAP